MEDLLIAGTAPDVEPDTEGPRLSVGFEGVEAFSSGDRIAGQPAFRIVISDPSGINITGETGHDIELSINDDTYTLTNLFNVLNGDYREGVVTFSPPELEPGEHTIRLKAWDTFNNSSRIEAIFELVEKGEKPIQNTLFYPNPLRNQSGYFTYDLTETAQSVRIKIFALSGRLVGEVNGSGNEGYNQILWEAPADLANGSYLYKIEAERIAGGAMEQAAILQLAR